MLVKFQELFNKRGKMESTRVRREDSESLAIYYYLASDAFWSVTRRTRIIKYAYCTIITNDFYIPSFRDNN